MPPGWRTSRWRALTVLLAALLPGGAAQGQGTLLTARVEVSLPSSKDPIPVVSSFTLRPDRDAHSIPVSLLSPEPIRLLSLRVLIDGHELESDGDEGSSFIFERVREHYWEGSAQLPPETQGTRDSITLQISYSVEGGWTEKGRATIPLIVPRWVPFEPLPETFTARIAVPEGLTVSGSFPTTVINKPDPGREGTYELGLQAVPAMLILRTEDGIGSPVTLERALDLVVVLILLVMGAAGIRFLRRKDG